MCSKEWKFQPIQHVSGKNHSSRNITGGVWIKQRTGIDKFLKFISDTAAVQIAHSHQSIWVANANYIATLEYNT